MTFTNIFSIKIDDFNCYFPSYITDVKTLNGANLSKSNQSTLDILKNLNFPSQVISMFG